MVVEGAVQCLLNVPVYEKRAVMRIRISNDIKNKDNSYSVWVIDGLCSSFRVVELVAKRLFCALFLFKYLASPHHWLSALSSGIPRFSALVFAFSVFVGTVD